MGYYLIINDVRWYYRLKPQESDNGRKKRGLFSDNPRHTLTSSLIVSLSYHDPTTNKVNRLYAWFKSYLEFAIYQSKLPQHERCFYEIILGESAQKPHFDIDINNKQNQNRTDGELVKDCLLEAIITVLEPLGVGLNLEKDVLIYTSHSKEKQSYHIVIDNWCHTNNVEARGFYDKIVETLDEKYIPYIDKAVYSPTQQFRIVGSQKIGSDRIKKFERVWKYKEREITHRYPETPDDPQHEYIMQLESSIVGFTSNCKFLPPFKPQIKEKQYIESEEVTRSEAREAIGLIAMAGKISVADPRFPYKFLDINGPIVMLKRIKPSRCKICNRIHEHENPYLLVVGEEKSVYFHCRRAPESKKLFLGKLNPSSDDESGGDNNATTDSENKNIQLIKHKWSKNVIDRVNRLAKTSNNQKKKTVSAKSDIDPKYKKKLINLYLEAK